MTFASTATYTTPMHGAEKGVTNEDNMERSIDEERNNTALDFRKAVAESATRPSFPLVDTSRLQNTSDSF